MAITKSRNVIYVISNINRCFDCEEKVRIGGWLSGRKDSEANGRTTRQTVQDWRRRSDDFPSSQLPRLISKANCSFLGVWVCRCVSVSLSILPFFFFLFFFFVVNIDVVGAVDSISGQCQCVLNACVSVCRCVGVSVCIFSNGNNHQKWRVIEHASRSKCSCYSQHQSKYRSVDSIAKGWLLVILLLLTCYWLAMVCLNQHN